MVVALLLQFCVETGEEGKAQADDLYFPRPWTKISVVPNYFVFGFTCD